MAHGTWKFAAQASMDDLRHGEGAQAELPLVLVLVVQESATQ